MDIKIGYKRDYITYGTVVSLMLDYDNINKSVEISYDPENFFNQETKNNSNDNFIEFLTSKDFLFTHGVFNEYCYLHRFRNTQDFRNAYLNTAFIVLPAFEFESMDNLNKLIKKAQKTGISNEEGGEEVTENRLYDNFIKFQREIQTNHDKTLKLMKKDNNKVNYYDSFQLMHLKSGSFLEFKRNNKDLKTYIQLTNSMSKRTLFRFIPSYEYQTMNSTNVFFFLSVQIACGEKRNNKDKYICCKNDETTLAGPREEKSSSDAVEDKGEGKEERKEESKEESKEEKEIILKREENIMNGDVMPTKSIFNGDELKNTIKDIYRDENLEDVINEFVTYSINENLFQNNFGSNIMPDDDYLITSYENHSFWRLINISEDYFEDLKYLNLFDHFCIQSTDKNLFINVDIEENGEQNHTFLVNYTNNSKSELKTIKEEDDEKDEINIIDTNINKHSLSENPGYINNKSINNSNPKFFNENQVQLDYDYEIDQKFIRTHKLLVESYEDNEHLKPYSLFRFEPINEDLERAEYGFGSLAKFSLITEGTEVRIFNTFTNKVLYAEKIGKNKFKLLLIDDIGKDDRRYDNTVFEIIQIDSQDDESEETRSEKEEENSAEEIKESQEEIEKIEGIKKNSLIKFKSKKYLSYLGIRTKNGNNCGELVLTNSIADITRFKLNCIDEEDKHEVNFFEQLLLGFNNIMNYFRHENKTFNLNGKNYEKITHILNKFKNKLYMFQKDESEDSNLKLQENKFDFLEIIKHFNIVSKLIEIFLTNWFQNYQLYSYNQLEEKLKKFFKENKDILKYKLIVSKVILEILTKIYDLKKSYLNIIEDSLLYFLMFVGRYDKCTSFLIHILTNNSFLLVSLCPLYKANLEINPESLELEESYEINNISSTLNADNEEIIRRKKRFKQLKYYNIKKCFERIIKDYNRMDIDYLRVNFCTISLLFLFLKSLLIYRDDSFQQFYEGYFTDFGLLKKDKENDIVVPNYENNQLLIYFYLNDGEIFARKTPFLNKDKMSDGRFLEYKLIDLVDIIGNYNLETKEDRNRIFFAKLVNINLTFYSDLSLCDNKFKNYLQQTFRLEDLTTKFLTFKYNIINNPDEINNILPRTKTESPLLNDTKCSVIKLMAFLYLKKGRPYNAKTHLFKNIKSNSCEENIEVNVRELERIVQFISDIFENKYTKFEINGMDQLCLIQFIELIKYVLRNLYLKKKNKEKEIRENIYYLIFHMVKLLETILGISEQEVAKFFEQEKKEKEEEEKNIKKEHHEIKKDKSLNSIIYDKLELNDPMILISENFEYVFLRIRNKLQKLVSNPKELINEINFFLNILRDICDSKLIQKTKYDLDLAKVIKHNKKLLQKFDLKSVLMNVSVLNNRNDSYFSNSILFRIEQIIKEFLQYLEFSTMEDLGANIPKDGTISKKEFKKRIISEILEKKISSKYLDEFRNKRYNKHTKVISLCFFKFLQVIEHERLRSLALDILFYLNSSKNIFYFNVNNLVIMDNDVQYTKFLDLKNVFVQLFKSIRALNMAPRVDNNSLVLIQSLSKDIIENLLEKLFDDTEWTRQKNALNRDENFQFQDPKGLPSERAENSLIFSEKDEKIEEEDPDKEEDHKSEKEEDIKLIKKSSHGEENKEKERNDIDKNKEFHYDSIQTIEENSLIQKEPRRKKSKKPTDQYFMNEFDDENLKIYQQTLYNLGFIDFIVEFFTYIDKLTELKADLEGEFRQLEEAIISIYKILVPFFYNNSNNEAFIRLRLYLLICPLKFKSISNNLLYSINYFIYHLVYNFKSKTDYLKISFIDKVIDELFLLHQLDWNLHKDVMPYFFLTLLMFFEYSTPEHIFPIFTLLDDIKNVVVNDIVNDNYNKNSVLILVKLLKLIENEHNKKLSKESKEYKNRPILPISNIIKAVPKMIECLNPKEEFNNEKLIFSVPLILIVNLIMEHYDLYYKLDLEENKNEIYKSLLDFCRNELILTKEYIYSLKNNHINIKYFNEFIGISILKLFILLSFSGIQDDNISIIYAMPLNLYEIIDKMVDKNNAEIIFLEEKNKDDINQIYEFLGEIGDTEKIFHIENILNKKQILQETFDEIKTDEENNSKNRRKKDSSSNENNRANDEEENNELKNKLILLANSEVEYERKNYITKLFYFLDFINKNNISKLYNYKDISFYISFCESYLQEFGKYILKSRIFFLFWTNIYIMNYKGNPDENNKDIENLFEDENPIFNKQYFTDLSFVKYTIGYFEKMNLNINNYENLIYIKFLDSYLFKLDEEDCAEFLMKIIEMPESRNLFHLLHNILDNLFERIKYDIENKEYPKEKYLDLCPSSVNEKKINDSVLAIKFLTHLSTNNKIIKNKMKDYLRLQYNNSKNHNFIIILSEILESFSNNNIKLIPKYFEVIIAIIEFLSESCSGPCKGNQDCIVKHTHVLEFIKFVLRKLDYRKKDFDLDGNKIRQEENGINQNNNHVIQPRNRRVISYLKYKLLMLLNVITVEREKGDKIYDSVHQIIDFDVLKYVLVETYKEILIECEAKNTPNGDFIYEETLLNRAINLDAYLNNVNGENKFIIYENGTFAYLLINIYLENLTRPIDLDNQSKICDKKKKLENEKCKIIEKSHFNNFVHSMVGYYDNIVKCFKKISTICGNCLEPNDNGEDFPLKFDDAFSFYFKNTPHIEVLYEGKIYKYYIKLSPICNCLTPEMKDEFHKKIDRASAKTKTADLFNQVEFFRFQLIINKKILDTFSKNPILNLIFNHYKFYRNIFLMIAVVLNILIFMSYYRTTDDDRVVEFGEYDLNFDYGFLYKKENIKGTKKAFLVFTIIELVLAVLILINYFIFRVSYLVYFEDKKDKKIIKKIEKNREIIKFLVERSGSFILNVLSDIKLFYHLFLLAIIIVTLAWGQKYKILSVLLLDIIERSNTLMCIVKSFWLPKKQIIVTLILFYLVAYYFIIFVYLFIPHEVPKHDCLKFSDCYFTLCDQSIKWSNGLINYLIEDGLYIYDSLWSNPRFWIDNWFAILDIMLVMQMFCGIIIDTFLSQREKIRDIEKDKSNICFVCGLSKNDLNKYYPGENGFDEHIKLDHYLWNYLFAVFNVTTADEANMIYLDKSIKRGYEANLFSNWVPYNKCINKMEIDSNKKENEDEENENNDENKNN